MKDSLIDVSVLIIFFNRPETLQKVFEQVRQARPSRLFLYQDGPRNEKEIQKLLKCRKIVENIDWECEVETNYQEKNNGADKSGYIANKWAFSLTNKCIILEDDCVPSMSFFSFCKEMLDKYEDDNRIWLITGFNHEEISQNIKSDYFFSETITIGGWATWQRVINTWDNKYSFLDDPTAFRVLSEIVKEHNLRNDLIEFFQGHRQSGNEFFETILWSSMILNSGLAIVPTRNMITNIGIMADSVHFAGPLQLLPKGHRRIFTMGRYEINFPLTHPKYVIADTRHKHNMYRANAWNHSWIKIGRSFEELWLNIRYGNFKNIKKAIGNRFKKWFKGPFYK